MTRGRIARLLPTAALLLSGCYEWHEAPARGPCEAGSTCDCRAASAVPRLVVHMGTADPGLSTRVPTHLPHQERLRAPFWLGTYEATAGCYQRCIRAGACADPGPLSDEFRASLSIPDTSLQDGYWRDPASALLPIVTINWHMAAAYCEWLGGRLPTNAEWEGAARSDDGRTAPWRSPPPDPARPERLDEEERCRMAHRPRTRGWPECAGDDVLLMPVGSYPQGIGPFGHQDLLGNAREYVHDWFDVYPEGLVDDTGGPPSSPWGERVLREGWHGWDRTGVRPDLAPDDFFRYSLNGVRCAFDAEPDPLPLW